VDRFLEANRSTTLEAAGPGAPSDETALESMVLRVGRPVLDVKQGIAVLDITEVESQVWTGRLERDAPRSR